MLARIWRYTGLVLVGFLLLFAARFKGLPIRTDRQIEPRKIDPSAILPPAGWKVEAVLTELDAPADLAWGPDGALYIAETGFAGAYAATSGIVDVMAGRILRWQPGARDVSVYAAGFTPPLSGLAWSGKTLYASHRTQLTAIRPDRSRFDVVTGLPSYGDHGNNHIAIDPSGNIYITQGSATNTGVLGLDNWATWSHAFPAVHDIPCQSVELTKQNYATADPRALIPMLMRTKTGPFQPFGMASNGGIVKGEVPCNGAILKVKPDGSDLEVVAWGLRNPFGIAFDRTGRLLVTDQGPDSRGSRPVKEAPDLLRVVQPGAWYGWPDLWDGKAIGKPLLAKQPGEPPAPLTRFPDHTAATGLTLGPDGWLYVTEYGSAFPATGQDPAIHGFQVVRVHPESGKIETVLRNRQGGPQSWTKSGGLERPVALQWGPDGALYILDYGRLQVTRQGPWVVPKTGVLWRLSRSS